jgi:thiosulfate/3-mercaptopyruvate sulfurtransferase
MLDNDPASVVSPLVETEWLARHLTEPALRILDCTAIAYAQDGAVHVESGRSGWRDGHIPGSGFADLVLELSAKDTTLPLMMPTSSQFAEAMGRYGVGPGTRVVLYDRSSNIWATRVWWMLRVFGFDDASVLSGGWQKWTAEGRPVSAEPADYRATRFVAQLRPGLIVSKADVMAAIGDPGTVILNTLSREDHAGTVARYGRPGHIPGSHSMPARSLLDSANTYRGVEELRAEFATSGALEAKRVITYCGAGIAATSNAMILTLLGMNEVAVYDGSMSEWAADPAAPLITG